LSFFALLAELLIIVLGVYILSNRALTRGNFLILIIGGGVVIYPLFLLVGQLTFPLLAITFSVYLLIKTDIKWIGILWLVGALIAATISDFLTFKTLLWLYDSSNLIINSYSALYGVMYTAGILIFTTLICSLLAYVLRRIRIRRLISSEHLPLLVFASFAVIGSLFFNIRVLGNIGVELRNTTELLLVILFYIITLLMTVLITIQITKDKNQLESEREQAKQLNVYTMELEEQYQAIRKNRHDYMNILTSMTEYTKKSDIQGLQNYIEKEVLPAEKRVKFNEKQLNHLLNLQIMSVKGLIATKLIFAQVNDINVTVEIPEVIAKWNISNYDIVKILGILLDNAIEENEHCHNPEINVGIFPSESGWTIIVENSCRLEIEHPVQLRMEGFSTKGEGRGLGLSILDEIVAKNEQLLLETNIERGKFTQMLVILEKSEVNYRD